MNAADQDTPVNAEAEAARALSEAADVLRIWSEAGKRFDDDAETKRRDLVLAMADMCDELGLGCEDELMAAADSLEASSWHAPKV